MLQHYGCYNLLQLNNCFICFSSKTVSSNSSLQLIQLFQLYNCFIYFSISTA